MSRIASVLLALSIAANASALSGARQSDAPVRPVVNVNTATVVQLAYLPGVGPKLAAAIVAYRTGTVGRVVMMDEVDDLLSVKGIGPAKLAKMRPYVVLKGATTATAKITVAKVVTP